LARYSRHYTSRVTDADGVLYDLPNDRAPNRDGWLDSGDGHEIYWHEYGNPAGLPVLFVHGGPGGGTDASDARYFDPARYRVILFDQRGCGRSRPDVGRDPVAALTGNTTTHLIADMERLRERVIGEEKVFVFGGSWGSTLSLAYAIAHPERVLALILRGVFLCRKRDVDYLYQGNATTVHLEATRFYDPERPGAYMVAPEAWKTFVEVIDPDDRGNMVDAYYEILRPQEPPHPKLARAARAWSGWEGAVSYISAKNTARFEGGEFAVRFARIENHYFRTGGLPEGDPFEPGRREDYILGHVDRIKDIPIHIVHGQFDQVCPRANADELVAALEKAGAAKVYYVLTPAGHSARERETARELRAVMDAFASAGPGGSGT
jgi:proline iminopeptidase